MVDDDDDDDGGDDDFEEEKEQQRFAERLLLLDSSLSGGCSSMVSRNLARLSSTLSMGQKKRSMLIGSGSSTCSA